MKKLRVAKPAEIVDGMLVINLDSTEASSDWLRYGRLRDLAEKGDEEARKEAERMDNAEMIEMIDDE